MLGMRPPGRKRLSRSSGIRPDRDVELCPDELLSETAAQATMTLREAEEMTGECAVMTVAPESGSIERCVRRRALGDLLGAH